MPTRREIRERALSLCYEAETRNLQTEEILAELPIEADPYTVELLRGVEGHRVEIDQLLGKLAEHWTLDRMPVIDLALLRLATYELGWLPDIPTAVVISEAVDLAKEYSTAESGKFVNGVLANVADSLRGTS